MFALTLPPITLLDVAVLALAFALADRTAGSSIGDRIPVLTSDLVADVGILAALSIRSPILAGVFGLGFAIWRAPAWDLLGGTMTPRTPRQLRDTFARHAIAPGSIAVLCLIPATGLNPLAALGCFSVWALAATALGWALGRARISNGAAEILRGLGFGLAASAVWALS